MYLFDRLAHFKVPTRILILPEIPKGSTGKVKRFEMAKALGLSQKLQQGRSLL